jgi:hypothetical protein
VFLRFVSRAFAAAVVSCFALSDLSAFDNCSLYVYDYKIPKPATLFGLIYELEKAAGGEGRFEVVDIDTTEDWTGVMTTWEQKSTGRLILVTVDADSYDLLLDRRVNVLTCYIPDGLTGYAYANRRYPGVACELSSTSTHWHCRVPGCFRIVTRAVSASPGDRRNSVTYFFN